MPRLFNTHAEAETGAELRGWGYRKVADAAALAALTDQVVGEIVTRSDTGRSYQWDGATWDIWTRDGTVARENISGAATLDVTGHDAAELTITGNVASLAFTGWDADTDLYQRVRVQLIQDATGGRTLDWRDVAGNWVESPPDSLPLDASGTTLQFYAITTDGGTTVWLEPIGIQYGPGCAYMLANDAAVPAVSAGGTVTINHSYSHVASVELIEVATGQRVLADYRRAVATDPSSAILIDFTTAAAAGTWLAVVSGIASQPCALDVSADSEWDSIVLSVNNAASVTPRILHDGAASDVQWLWGDGSAPEDVTTNTNITHNYAPNYTGDVVLRFKRNVRFDAIDLLSESAWDFDVSALSPLVDMTFVRLQGTNVTGSPSAFETMPNLDVLNLALTNVSGSINGVAGLTSLTQLIINGTSISGDVGAVSALMALTSFDGYNTPLSGDIAQLAALTNLTQLRLFNTSVSGDVSSLATLTSLSLLVIYNANLTGDVNPLSALTSLTQVQLQNQAGITGDMSGFAAATGLTLLHLGDTGVSGDIANLAPLTALTGLHLTSTAVTGDPSVPVAAAVAQLDTFEFNSVIPAPAVGDLDNVLAVLAAGSVSGGLLDLAGTNPAITNTAAVTTLQGRGWTVLVN